MPIRWTFLLALLLSLSTPAWAIYKCVAPNGHITFSQAPCPNDSVSGAGLQSMGLGNSGGAAASVETSAAARMLRTLVMCERTGGSRWCDEDKRMLARCTPPPRQPKWVAPAGCAGYMGQRKTAMTVMQACQAGKERACAQVSCAGGDTGACTQTR